MPSLLPLSWAEFLTLAQGSDRIPAELFQILKDDAVESAALNMQYAICTQYAICRLPAELNILNHYLILEHFHHPRKDGIHPLAVTPHSLFPSAHSNYPFILSWICLFWILCGKTIIYVAPCVCFLSPGIRFSRFFDVVVYMSTSFLLMSK